MLTLALGSTNSRLTTRCRETLALSAIEIPTRLCCYYHRDTHSRPVHRTSQPCFCPIGTPIYQNTLTRTSRVSAAGFRPVHLGGPKPRRVICYDFFEGWLLLSLPPRCLRLTTLFSLSLSQHLGALTPVRVAPLTKHELNPCVPSPQFHGSGVFGVQKESERFPFRVFRLVLYPARCLPGDYAATYFDGN